MKNLLWTLLILLVLPLSSYAQALRCADIFAKELIFAQPELNQLAQKALSLSARIADPAVDGREKSHLQWALSSLYVQMGQELARGSGVQDAPKPLQLLEEYYGEFSLQAPQMIYWVGKYGLPKSKPRHRAAYFTEEQRRMSQIEMTPNGVAFTATGELLKHQVRHIFVVGLDGGIYVITRDLVESISDKIKHNSFFLGAPVLYSGSIVIKTNGEITELTTRSGHYRPTPLHFEWVQQYLVSQGFTLRPNCCRNRYDVNTP